MNAEHIKEIVKNRVNQSNDTLKDGYFLLNANRGNRTIVNRAYYATFYAALALLQTIGQTPRKHRGVLSLFDKEFVHPGHFDREYSKAFHRLFRLRQKDDYEFLDDVPREEAVEALSLSETFVREVWKYLTANGYLSPGDAP